jgi:hypothetical protein
VPTTLAQNAVTRITPAKKFSLRRKFVELQMTGMLATLSG